MLSRFVASLVCSIGCVFVLASCAGDLELAVDLRTDLVPGVEFDAVRLTVDGAVQPLVSAPLDATVERGVRVYEAQLGSGRHVVNVTLLRGAEEIVGRNYVIQLERSLIFAAVLTRDCRGVECPGAAGSVTDSECLGGRCVDPACDEPGGPSCPTIEPDCVVDADCESTIACVTPICASGVCLRVSEVGACPAGEYCDPESGCAPIPVSPTDAGTPDAGRGDVGGVPDAGLPDAGLPDAGLPDAGLPDAGCSSASQCDDGIDCTVDACSSGDCTHTNDDAACGTGMCDPAGTGADPSTGCVPQGPCRGQAAGFVCRASRGDCDVEETCDGTSIDCPTDTFLPGSMTCRPALSADLCDRAETCTGTGPDCPTDTFLPSSTTCRPALSTDLCDRAETCTGSSASCPIDTFLPSSTTCRPALSANLCDRAEMCSGTGRSCPADTFLPMGSVCRTAPGACDTPEVCSGSSATCPTDAFLSSSTVCRPAPGACDVAESCSGSSAACPTDVVRGMGFSCRPTTGLCDPGEVCNGVLATCPTDLLSPSTTVCNAALEACDMPEMCTGSAALCPGGATDMRRDSMLHPVPMPAAPVLFDLNADGHPELFVQSGTRDVSVWRGTADGAFTSPTVYNYPNPIFGIALADLDRDGFFELLVSTRDVVTIRAGTAAGFVGTTSDSVSLGGAARALAVGDFDGDAVVDDVVVLTPAEAVSLQGNGLLLSLADRYPLAGRTALAVGDIDGDPFPDVVIGGNDVFDTLHGIGSGRFTVSTQPVAAAVQYLVLAPLTCDRSLSAVIDDQAGRVVVMLNMGGGNLVAQPGLAAGPIAGLAAGDINRDDLPDLVTLEPGVGFLVFFGRGNATWTAGVPFGYTRANRGLVIRDTDGDGHPDVVLGASNGVDVLLQ